MSITHHFDSKLHAIRVVINGDIDAQEMEKAFIEIYGQHLYPTDANAIWMMEEGAVDIDVMELFKLARFSQSEREIDGYPATAFVTKNSIIRGFCEEYMMLVKEAPYELRLFDNLKDAERWIKNR